MSAAYIVREAVLLHDKTTQDSDTRGKILGRFQCNLTGKGVAIYRRNEDGVVCAQKRFALNQSSSFEREIFALQRCGSHSNLIKLLDFYQDPLDGSLILCETLASGGTLTGLLTEINRPMSSKEAFFYACELIETVHFIHEQGILHHDIKEENVFVQKDGHIIIGDFGLSRPLKLGDSMPNFWSNQSAHMPFEVHSDALNYPLGRVKFQITHAVDWFSVGVLLYVLIRYQLPFSKPLIPENAPFALYFPPETCPQIRDLLQGLLTTRPSRRLGGSKLFLHSWMQGNSTCKEVIEAVGVDGFRKFIRDKRLVPPFLPTITTFC